MRVKCLARRLVAMVSLFLAFVSTPFAVAIAAPIPSIDPPVPHVPGQPCVVELFHNRAWPQNFVSASTDPTINYAPPTACPPPWSKVILQVSIQSNRRSVQESLGIDLNNVRLFRGAVPRYDGTSSWRVERDLTDYSALFKVPQTGLIFSSQEDENADSVDAFAFTGSARLLFYPATAAYPAPAVPDAVIAVNQGGGTSVNLPTNIVRAYLDVEADYQDNPFDGGGIPTTYSQQPFWYSCYRSYPADQSLSTAIASIYAPGGQPLVHIFPPFQGCSGGSFQEITVDVDGTPAGIAPAFPLVVADLNPLVLNSADQPITTLEMLNFKPYRVDLTPFAAVLSAGVPHDITASNPPGFGFPGYRSSGTTLLLYLDPHVSQVTGAVTLNTLATESGTPVVVDTVQQSGNIIQGDIDTKQQRDFEIHGFVITSQGRIDSCVHQISHFSNTQTFHLESNALTLNIPVDELYSQKISLASSVQQTSQRKINGWVISWDRTAVHYPLEMTYDILGESDNMGDTEVDGVARGTVMVKQKRIVDGDHYQPGLGHFTTHAEAGFQSVVINGFDEPDPFSESSTTRGYKDNYGSCYRATMTSSNGAITAQSHGQGCPGNYNNVIWFAHPDGSPASNWWQ
jgi:hypothetical protein